MILIIRLSLEKLKVLGKNFPWKKPFICLNCGSSRIWGHGYVLRYFWGYSSGLWIKRLRCDDCGTVFTLRPDDYPPGFQYPWEQIKASVANKMGGQIYFKMIPRQNQQYWLKAFKFQCLRSKNWPEIQSIPIIQKLVTFRLNYHEIPWTGDPPYLPFAVTMKALRI